MLGRVADMSAGVTTKARRGQRIKEKASKTHSPSRTLSLAALPQEPLADTIDLG
jgi:hypothetical protein